MNETLLKDAVLRVGEVCGIEGRKVFIKLDKEKNSSDLLFNGEILKNISVGSYVEIKKGFLSIIGKAEGEKLEEDNFKYKDNENQYRIIDKNKRTLIVTLSGFIGSDGRFIGGIKEMPLIGNEAFILTESKIHTIHDLLKKDSPLKICIAKTDIEEIPINFPIDGLFNSHIAIFGNTGSGKSNTLTSLYQSMISTLSENANFKSNCKFFFLDFNGEFTKENCICKDKIVYNLTTKDDSRDKIPMAFDELMDIETLSILLEATEKTQKPFLKRALDYFNKVKNPQTDTFVEYFKKTLQYYLKSTLKMTSKDAGFRILDYLEEVLLLILNTDGANTELRDDIFFHDTNKYFYYSGAGQAHDNRFIDHEEKISETKLYIQISLLEDTSLKKVSHFNQFYIFLLLQIINDLLRNKIQYDHIIPVISRFKAKQASIERVFEVKENSDLWNKLNIVVLNLRDVNLDMRKTIPLLMAKHIYSAHKKENNKKSLSIIIDEAHNILSKTSFRETEDWKDYRLETFEEIIKEGRKFGVFVTIASQRPNDISETIISQAHNYFIHQLINQKDLQTIGNAVSYIDKITEESIPTLPVGTCVFSGIATPMPLKLKINELPSDQKPDSNTLKFEYITRITS